MYIRMVRNIWWLLVVVFIVRSESKIAKINGVHHAHPWLVCHAFNESSLRDLG